MSRQVDLHPEHLLERERADELSADDQARLDQHAAQCAPCAFERALHHDFAQELAAQSDDDALLARLSAGALGAPTAAVGDSTSKSQRRQKRTNGRWQALAVVATLTFGAGAAAAAAGAWWFEWPTRSEPARIPAPETRRRAPRPEPPESTPAQEPVAETKTRAVAGKRARRRAASRSRQASPQVVEPPAPAVTAADLFAQANQARRARDYRQAAGLYGRLQQEFRGSPEEVLSRVSLARLRLERFADARGALTLFDSYLQARPRGTLAEEALSGRAVALMRLGRAQAEAQAWKRLLARFPASVHRERARRRLEHLAVPK